MKRIALINQKGGTGKTTTAVNVGAGLASLGNRVLLVDLDPQAHLTMSLGIQARNLERSIYELLRRETTLEEVVIERTDEAESSQQRGNPPGLRLVPSNLSLSRADTELAGMRGREFLLREALQGARGFDYLLVDCPPSLGVLTLNALTAVREVYIPLQTEFLALQGLSRILETVEVVESRLNPGLEITGIIGVRFDKRKNLNREVIENIRGYFRDKVFKTLIRDNISLAEAPSYGKTIFEYAPKSYGAEDYLSLSREIIRRG